jgi:hypothetical protein
LCFGVWPGHSEEIAEEEEGVKESKYETFIIMFPAVFALIPQKVSRVGSQKSGGNKILPEMASGASGYYEGRSGA